MDKTELIIAYNAGDYAASYTHSMRAWEKAWEAACSEHDSLDVHDDKQRAAFVLGFFAQYELHELHSDACDEVVRAEDLVADLL